MNKITYFTEIFLDISSAPVVVKKFPFEVLLSSIFFMSEILALSLVIMSEILGLK